MKVAWLILIVLLLGASPGCAFLNRDNTLLFNQVEEHLVPDDTGWQVAVFPLTFCTGLVALCLDAVIVHPCTVIADAAEDTRRGLWDDFDWDEQYVTECTCLPWRAVFTPLAFTGAFLGRSIFDIPTRAEAERKRKMREADRLSEPSSEAEAHRKAKSERLLKKVHALLDRGDYGKALILLKELHEQTGGAEADHPGEND